MGDMAEINTFIQEYSAFVTFSGLNVVVQSLSHVQLIATPWTAAHQASLSFTISRSLLRLMTIELVMSSNHLILCHSLLLLPSIFPSIRVFSNESTLRMRWPKYWSFSFSISHSNEIFPMMPFHGDVCVLISHVQLFVNPWTVAHKAPLSMEFSRQEYWSGLPFPSEDLPNPGIEPGSPALQVDSSPSEPPGKPMLSIFNHN